LTSRIIFLPNVHKIQFPVIQLYYTVLITNRSNINLFTSHALDKSFRHAEAEIHVQQYLLVTFVYAEDLQNETVSQIMRYICKNRNQSK
jgi:hypothetical protein